LSRKAESKSLEIFKKNTKSKKRKKEDLQLGNPGPEKVKEDGEVSYSMQETEKKIREKHETSDGQTRPTASQKQQQKNKKNKPTNNQKKQQKHKHTGGGGGGGGGGVRSLSWVLPLSLTQNGIRS